MKTQLMKITPVVMLLLVSALSLSAQSTLPDPHNDSCWSSLSSLRACQLQVEQEQQDYAQRCTSYPEYQCIPEYISLQRQPSAKHAANRVAAKTGTTVGHTASSTVPSETSSQQAN